MGEEVWEDLDRATTSRYQDWPRYDLSDYSISKHGFLPGEEPLARFQDSEHFDEYDEETQEYLATLDEFYAAIPDMEAANRRAEVAEENDEETETFLDRIQDIYSRITGSAPEEDTTEYVETGITDHIRSTAWHLPEAPENLFDQLSERELVCMYRGSAFAASSYVHAVDETPAKHLPAELAQPLYESTKRLGVPPILSYDAYSLYNAQKKDPDGPLELDNLETIQNFVNMEDEDWFMLVHVEIEDEVANALHAIPLAQRAAKNGSTYGVGKALQAMRGALADTVETMARMPEGNSPENYNDVFRPYIEAFDDIEYLKVDELDGPQSERGETGAQSSIYPALDGAFNIPHAKTELTEHIDDMRQYMPEGHRRFIEDVEAAAEQGAGITTFVEEHGGKHLKELHDDVLWNMNAFRSLHNFYAHRYIGDKTDDPKGTGNTNYEQFLGQLIEETEEQMFRDGPTSQLEYTMEVLGEERFMDLMGRFASQEM